MVLNISFNENEPIVCRPAEALDCFLRTKMDVLVLGNSILVRQQAESPLGRGHLHPQTDGRLNAPSSV
jgi:carbamoyltransferase